MDITCTACSKDFNLTDTAVRSDCGHLVHCFKQDCSETDFCVRCQHPFQIHRNSPIVNLNIQNDKEIAKTSGGIKRKLAAEEEINLKPAIKLANTLETSKTMEQIYAHKFEEQRKINLEIMKKLTTLSSSHENLVSLFKEQAQTSKMIIESLTKIISQEMPKLKNDILDLYEQVDDLLYEDCEDYGDEMDT